MFELEMSSEELINGLLELSKSETVCVLDSCGSRNLGSHLMIAGFKPVSVIELSSDKAGTILSDFDRILLNPASTAIFTVSYEFGLKLHGIDGFENEEKQPDIVCFEFTNLIVHDYSSGVTRFKGPERSARALSNELIKAASRHRKAASGSYSNLTAASNMDRDEYLSKIEVIQEEIRSGNTYQTNLTQQISVDLGYRTEPQDVFSILRSSHPAAFAAFIKHKEQSIASISPERFVTVDPRNQNEARRISSSPIKGTRKRTGAESRDNILKTDLLESKKDRAENTMIVDLIRNDLGRICEFGSVEVEKLCELEEHETLFHLVSTVSGLLRPDIKPSDILTALFPCGSITGCPKISTMKLIRKLENKPRGISMGTIGYCDFEGRIDMSVAIRTVTFNDHRAVFNVGGGVVIDSDPESEYEESLLKAHAILCALGAKQID